MVNCMCGICARVTAVETQTVTDWKLQQHDGHAACVIAQQYSSVMFVSLSFSFRAGKKCSFVTILILVTFFFLILKSEIATRTFTWLLDFGSVCSSLRKACVCFSYTLLLSRTLPGADKSLAWTGRTQTAPVKSVIGREIDWFCYGRYRWGTVVNVVMNLQVP